MKTQIITNMGSFVLGTGATLVALASWLGTADLTEIKESVQSYVTESEQHTSALIEEYNVLVDSANAEIGDYKKALEKANQNISELVTIYEESQTKAEEDYSDLQQAYDEMVARLDSQYETDMNAIIEQANIEINKANEEVAQAKTDVNTIIEGSQIDEIASGEKSVLDTTGDKTVTDIVDMYKIASVDNLESPTEGLSVEGYGAKQKGDLYKFNFNNGTSVYILKNNGSSSFSDVYLGVSLDGGQTYKMTSRVINASLPSFYNEDFANIYYPLIEEYFAQ